ncbi:hypothetical protein O1W71_01920 [Microbacterium sp. H37-C3]|uniref:hypothetical protein n=1 Tax=Microbacterium sp. H37-C3 TaxID=3004354 RepID=UPI0022AFA3AE|nr:hypothetical protein [Microbacterium sp. H37-C3]MCZ4066425.1 hypothetical protein [Microbacterium sp. H37-C3]
MFTINGVPLDNTAYGWLFRKGSQPFITLEAQVGQVTVVGQRGITQYQTGVTAGLWPCIIYTPDAHRETLNALFGAPKLLLSPMAKPDRVAEVQFMASEVDRIFPRGEFVDMRYTLALLDAAWRDRDEVTTAFASLAAAASVTVRDLLPGGSAPVQDAVIRVRGNASGLQVTDPATGAWFAFSEPIPAGSYLRFEAKTGRAWLTTTDTWTGGTEVSGSIDTSDPYGGFEITPTFAGQNAHQRSASLVVSTGTRGTTTAVQVRARRAYIA